jgi:hypothetical protein
MSTAWPAATHLWPNCGRRFAKTTNTFSDDCERDEVPSDELRKDWMVLQIVDLVEERRAELEEEAAYAASK